MNFQAEYGIIATTGMRLTFAQMNQLGLTLNRELNKEEHKLRLMGAKAYFRIPGNRSFAYKSNQFRSLKFTKSI